VQDDPVRLDGCDAVVIAAAARVDLGVLGDVAGLVGGVLPFGGAMIVAFLPTAPSWSSR
jgi:hypothetical protein